MKNQFVFDSQVYHGCREFDDDISQTVNAQYGTGGNNQRLVVATNEPNDGETVYCLAGNGIDRTDKNGCNGRGWTEDVSYTLNTIDRPAVAFSFCSYTSNAMKSDNPISGCYETEVARTIDNNGGNPSCHQGGTLITEQTRPAVAQVGLSVGNGQTNNIAMSETANALDTMHDQQCVMTFQAFGVYSERLAGSALKARNEDSNRDLVVGSTKQTVRRLTPLECERLQGFPDFWTAVPGASDSKRYMALGNSIALPFWAFLARRFVEMGEVKTIGSLFDGIGGFPLVFKRAGAETLWTSEIEPFCENVVKYHIDKGDL